MKRLIIGLAAMLALTVQPEEADAKTDKKDPVVMTIAGRDVKRSEFEYFYNKNNGQEVAEEKTFDEYVDLFVNYKLKVAEAYRQGVDTTRSYLDELAGYRKQIAEPYLQIQGWPDSLLQQAKDRRKWEVKASHLLLTCSEDTPENTVDSLYGVIQGLQHEVEQGASFDSLAREYSQDPSARQNAGDLGYFTSLQMVYPFEQAAFTTPVGHTSIVRTRFGWHLIKVFDKRESEGEVQVAHIMKTMARGPKSEGFPDPKQQIDSIYNLLQAGGDWDTICAENSDDAVTAPKGGAYPWLNHMDRHFPKEWLDVCYELQEKGDISRPFATQFGWHIIKLLDKRKEAPADSALDAKLKEQLAKDPERIKEGQRVYVDQCRARLAANKKLRKQAAGWSDEQVLEWADAQLESDNADFRNLYREYHDGLMLFDVSSKAVWDKASQDTVGLQRYFDGHRSDYAFDKPRFKGAFIECADDDALYNKLKDIYDHHAPLAASDVVRKEVLTDSILTPNPKAPRFHIVNGLFSEGDNACIDAERLHVEGAKFTPKEKMPRVMTYGQVLTEPDELADVRGAVVADYQNVLEEAWVAELRKKFDVKINWKELNKLR